MLAKKSVSVQLKEFSETEHPSSQIGTQNFTPLRPVTEKPLFCSFWVISVRMMLLVTSNSILHFSLFCTWYKWNCLMYILYLASTLPLWESSTLLLWQAVYYHCYLEYCCSDIPQFSYPFYYLVTHSTVDGYLGSYH